jgi:hypothetical protein
MQIVTNSPAIAAQAEAHTSLEERMISFVSPSATLSLRRRFTDVAYNSRPCLKQMTGFKVITIYSLLLTTAFAATDCEILNSGISSISSTACCADTAGIVCVNDRVTEMLEFSHFNSSSVLTDVEGRLPLELGNVTELTKLDIIHSDLSVSPVPDSIEMCTKLERIRFWDCKLQGQFPVGLRTLKALRIFINV